MDNDIDDISNLSTSTIVKEQEQQQQQGQQQEQQQGQGQQQEQQQGQGQAQQQQGQGQAQQQQGQGQQQGQEDVSNSKKETVNTKSINKEALVSIIREWVKNDNEIRELKKQETIRKNANKALTTNLIEIMRSNELDCFDINDGCILYKKTNVKKSLSKKTLYQLLNEYYTDDSVKASEVSNFLMEKREQVVKEKIVRKLWNPV